MVAHPQPQPPDAEPNDLFGRWLAHHEQKAPDDASGGSATAEASDTSATESGTSRRLPAAAVASSAVANDPVIGTRIAPPSNFGARRAATHGANADLSEADREPPPGWEPIVMASARKKAEKTQRSVPPTERSGRLARLKARLVDPAETVADHAEPAHEPVTLTPPTAAPGPTAPPFRSVEETIRAAVMPVVEPAEVREPDPVVEPVEEAEPAPAPVRPFLEPAGQVQTTPVTEPAPAAPSMKETIDAAVAAILEQARLTPPTVEPVVEPRHRHVGRPDPHEPVDVAPRSETPTRPPTQPPTGPTSGPTSGPVSEPAPERAGRTAFLPRSRRASRDPQEPPAPSEAKEPREPRPVQRNRRASDAARDLVAAKAAARAAVIVAEPAPVTVEPPPLEDPEPEQPGASASTQDRVASEMPGVYPFRPKRAVRRVLTVAMVAAMAGGAYFIRAAVESKDTASIGLAAIVVLATAMLWAIRAGASVTTLTLRQGQLEVVQQGGRFKLDMASQYTLVEVHGQPGKRGWKVVFPRRGLAPFVVDASMVDPDDFMRVLRFFRPSLIHH